MNKRLIPVWDNIPMPDSLRLLDEAELCALLNVPRTKFQKLRRRRLIPFIRLGYRSYKYDPRAVRAALDRLKVKAVS